MIRRFLLPAALLAASVAACESSITDKAGEEARPGLHLQADSVVSANRSMDWTARLVNGKGNGVAGSAVTFTFVYAGEGTASSYPFATDEAVTDANGYATVRRNPFYHGNLVVRARTGSSGQDTASVSVRVRPSVRLTGLNDTIPVDSVSLKTLECGLEHLITGAGSTPPGTNLAAEVRYVVQDGEVAGISTIPNTGGFTARYGRGIYARFPGTTRIIATGEAGGVDTILVRVTDRNPPLALLGRMPANAPTSSGFIADSLVVARGDTATLTVATDPTACQNTILPTGFAVTLQSVNPAIAAIEATEAKTWRSTSFGATFSIGTNARLRGAAVGRTEVVATAPYSAPKRVTIIVR